MDGWRRERKRAQRPLMGQETMEEQSLPEIMKDWEYHLLAPTHCNCIGYSGLLIAIRRQSTSRHCEPKMLRLPLRDAKGTITLRTQSSLSPAADLSQVCPGRVILSDRLDKRIEFFTFGSLMEVTCEPGEIIYLLRSVAPILELTTPVETIPNLMAAETESLVAQARARWGRNDKGFSRRLASVDPFQFYLASLHSILLYYEQVHTLELTYLTYHAFCEALHREKHWLVAEGLWPTNPPVLEDLLAPD